MWVLSWSFEHEEGFWVVRTMKGTNTPCWLCLLWPAVFCMQSTAAIMIIRTKVKEVTLLKAPWLSSMQILTTFTWQDVQHLNQKATGGNINFIRQFSWTTQDILQVTRVVLLISRVAWTQRPIVFVCWAQESSFFLCQKLPSSFCSRHFTKANNPVQE